MARGYFQGHEIQERRRSGRRWYTVDQLDEPRFETCEEAAAWIAENLEPKV